MSDHRVTADAVSWVPVPVGSDFPLQNLPFGIFATDGSAPRVGVAIGDHVLDLDAVTRAGLLDGPGVPTSVFAAASLNPLLELGRVAWRAIRGRIAGLLTEGNDELAGAGIAADALVPRAMARMHLPIAVGDYVDFYSSEQHATNVGKMLRPGSDPLPANWRHLPVGYHGRSSTIVVSGTDVVRPIGQRLNPDGGSPLYGPSVRLDIELEVGFVAGGPGNSLGEAIAIDDTESHIFGLCLVNDWSARDIQAWEYQPLGPFLGKSFATTISPWVVPLDALDPYRVPPPPQAPAPLPYLASPGNLGLDLNLSVDLNGSVVSEVNFREMYWTMAQQLAHATVNGAVVRPGDLFASGTVSGRTVGSLGSLLEMSWNGERPIALADGTTRTFLEDGDRVTLRGWCGGDERPRVGFGECTGTVASPAADSPPRPVR